MVRKLLIFFLIFNAIGAYYGSFMLLADPTGATIGLPPDMLERAPFQDFFVPGILLFLVNGVLPTLAVVGLIGSRPRGTLPFVPFFKKYHWGWTMSLLSGLGLIIWMAVQIALLGYYGEVPVQAVISVLGVLITGLALLPAVRKSCLIN